MKNHTKIFWLMTYKTLIGPKPLQIKFDQIDGFIRTYDVSLISQ